MCNKHQHARLRPLSLSALNRLILRPIYNTCRRPESEILMMKSQMTNFVLDHYKRELLVRAVIWNEDQMKGVLSKHHLSFGYNYGSCMKIEFTGTGEGETGFDSLIWLNLAYSSLSEFFFVCVCPDNLRPRFRSQQLNLFPPPHPPAKANLLALTIFKMKVSNFWVVI